MRIQSIRVVTPLIVDVLFNIGKNWVQNIFYMSNERDRCLLLLLSRRFLIRSCLFVLLFSYFSDFETFVTTSTEKYQFQSQVRLSQINIIVPIRSRIKLNAVFMKWGSSSINLMFVGRQDIVNYWGFPSKNSKNGHKRLVPKTARHD